MAVFTRILMALTGVKHGKNLRMRGNAFIFNRRGASLSLGDNVRINSSFLSNMVGLYQRTIVMTRRAGAEVDGGFTAGITALILLPILEYYLPAPRTEMKEQNLRAVIALIDHSSSDQED